MTMEADFVFIGSGSAGSAFAYSPVRKTARFSHRHRVWRAAMGRPLSSRCRLALFVSDEHVVVDRRSFHRARAALGGRVLCHPARQGGWAAPPPSTAWSHGAAHARDFDHCEGRRPAGWVSPTCSPYFKRMENARAARGLVVGAAGTGPLNVRSWAVWKKPALQGLTGTQRGPVSRSPKDYNGSKRRASARWSRHQQGPPLVVPRNA